MHSLLYSLPPTLQQANTHPCLCWRLLDTPRQVWVSLLRSHCSSLLGSGTHKLLFLPCKSLFPQSCVSSGSAMVGLMMTSSKRVYAIPKSASPRAPAPVAGHCWPVPPQEMLTHSSVSVSVGFLVPTRFVWALWVSPAGLGFDSKHEFAPPTILLGLLLCPWAWGISSQPLQCLPSCWALSDLDCGISPHSCSSATYVSLKLLYPPDDLILLSIYNNHLVPYYGFWLKVYFVWYKYSYFFLSVSICIEYLFLCLHFWVCVFLKLQSLL